MEITMFQMGFGESILLHQGDSCLLVDCGSESKHKDDYFDNVVRKLENYSKRSLLISHFHKDHINGVIKLLPKYGSCFETIYVPQIFETDDLALDLEIARLLLDNVLNKARKCYRIWNVLFNLIATGRTITLLKRGKEFTELTRSFCTLWPEPKDIGNYKAKLYKEVTTSLIWREQLSEGISFLANEIRAIVQLIDRPILSFTKSEIKRRIKEIDNKFDELSISYMQWLETRKKEGISTAYICQLYEKLCRENEMSIVFHTKDSCQPQILMTGDIGHAKMAELAKYSGDYSVSVKRHYHIFKAPHHGTATHYCDLSPWFNYDRLLISNGETRQPNRGPISDQYFLNGNAKHVYCTNTIQIRCEYMKNNNHCATVCTDCKAGGIRVNCISQIPEMAKATVGWIAQNTLREILENITDISLIKDLTTRDYSQSQFGIYYPVLVKDKTGKNEKRYYKKSLKIMGVEYYLCNDWREQNRQLLLNWIDAFTKSQEDKSK